MTPRPRPRDDNICRRAAENALPYVADWLDQDYNPNQSAEVLECLCQAFKNSKTGDGYEICRYLEIEYKWQPDASLVDTLDGAFIWQAEHEAVVAWVRENQPEPSCKVGDEISFNWYGGTWTAGAIKEICYNVANYFVSLSNGEGILVPFEDAHLLNPLTTSASVESSDKPPGTGDATNT